MPHILLCRTVWDSSLVPPNPYDGGGWTMGGYSQGKDDTDLLISGNAEPAPELVAWLRFLKSIQWTHKRMLFNLIRFGLSPVEKGGLDLFERENQKLTVPYIKLEERSWDFMPLENHQTTCSNKPR